MISSSNPTTETEVVREVYAAINRADIRSILRFLDPRMERVEPEGFPTAGTYRGPTEVLEHLSKGRGTWAEGGCEPERLLVVGDRVIAFVQVRVRLKSREDWIDGRVTDVFTFRNGKILEMRSFAEEQEALDWMEAGVSGSV